MKFSLGIFFISCLIVVVHCNLSELEQAVERRRYKLELAKDVEKNLENLINLRLDDQLDGGDIAHAIEKRKKAETKLDAAEEALRVAKEANEQA